MKNISIKKILLLAFVTAALLVGYSDDNTVSNEQENIRTCDTDAQRMAQSVEGDRTIGTYVLNPNNSEQSVSTPHQ